MKQLQLVLVLFVVLFALSCTNQSNVASEGLPTAVTYTNESGSIAAEAGGLTTWTLIPIGYGLKDQLDTNPADPGWKYLWVFFALHNNSGSYQALPENLGDVQVSTAEGYAYAAEGTMYPRNVHNGSQLSYLMPPGSSIIGSAGNAASKALYPISAVFKVSAASSGYSIQSANFGNISLSGVPELSFSHTDLDYRSRSGSYNLKRVLEKAAKAQSIEFASDFVTGSIPSFNASVPVDEDAEVIINSATRGTEGYNSMDVLKVELTQRNNNMGYGRQFNIQYYLLSDEGLLIVPDIYGGPNDSTGLGDEVGPGQAGPVTLVFVITEDAKGFILVATGEVQAVFNLGNPKTTTADIWRENDIN